MATQIKDGYKLELGHLYKDTGTEYMHVALVPSLIEGKSIKAAIDWYETEFIFSFESDEAW